MTITGRWSRSFLVRKRDGEIVRLSVEAVVVMHVVQAGCGTDMKRYRL